MKLKLTGLLFILSGFAAPFTIQKISPTFMYARILSLLCFWVGFLSILSPIEKNIEINSYLKWARYAVLINIVWSLLFLGYVQLMYYLESLQVTGYYTSKIFSFLSNPIGAIFDLIVPKPIVQQPDGWVLVTYSFARMLLTNFFSLLFYSIIGIFLKTIKDKKITSVCTGSQRSCAR